VALICAGAARASDDDDDLKELMADCGGAHIELSDVDGCLERARVLGETRPSPQLQSLMTRLERRTEDSDDTPASPPEPATRSPHVLATPAAAAGDVPPGKPGDPTYSQATAAGAERDKVSADLDASNIGDADAAAPKEIEGNDTLVPAEPVATAAGPVPHG
jgi:hypothetical protein